MHVELLYLLIFLALVVPAICLMLLKRSPAVSKTLAVAALIYTVTPAFYEYPSDRAMVTTFDESGQPIQHPTGRFCWEWSNDFSNMPTEPINLQCAVTVMTENPKMRRVVYYVSGQIVNPAQFYRHPERRAKDPEGDWSYSLTSVAFNFTPSSVQGWVDRAMAPYLYEFNDKHSKELATLSNPLDPKQQERAKTFFERTAEEIEVNEGIQVEFVGFALE